MARGRRQSLTNSGNPSSSWNDATPPHTSGNASQSGAVVMSMQPSHQQYEVPRLNDEGEKYMPWSHTMMLLLRCCGLWDIVSSAAQAPNLTTDPDAHADWYSKDQEALLQIIVTLKDGPHNGILDATSLKQCWDMLAKCYCAKGNQGAVHLMEKFFNTSLTDSEPIQNQIDQLKLTVRNLEAAGFALEDKWVAGLIIAKLPKSYTTLKTIFASISDSDQYRLSSNNVIDQALAEEARHIRSSGEDATAYFAKTSKKGNGWDKDKSCKWEKKVCSHCSFKGHEAVDCCKLKKEKEDEKKAKEKAAVASTSNSASADSTAKAAMARVPTDEVVRLF
jgi:hypothetical protein